MCSIEDLKIDIKSLVEGESTVAVSLGDDYFVSLESEEIMRGDVHVDVSIRKTIHFSDISFHATGIVQIPCDRCLDPMDHPVEVSHRLTVKLGNERSEDDDLIVVTDDDPVVDLAWVVYETIVLNLPVKHVHAPGKCNPAMINVLSEHSATRSDDETETKTVDPRWSALAKLQQADQDNTEIDNKN